VASAVYSQNFQKPMRLPNDTSIFRAELYGKIEGINYGARSYVKFSLKLLIEPRNYFLCMSGNKSFKQDILILTEKLYPTNTIVREIQNNIRNSDKNFIFC